LSSAAQLLFLAGKEFYTQSCGERKQNFSCRREKVTQPGEVERALRRDGAI